MVLGSTIAIAANYTPQGGTGLDGPGWTITDGGTSPFSGNFPTGVYSTVTNQAYARAVHPISFNNASNPAAFTVTYTFRVQNTNAGIWVGVASYPSGATGNALRDRSAQRMVGYPGFGTFDASVDGSSVPALSPATSPTNDSEYQAVISSTDGRNLQFQIKDMNGRVLASGSNLISPLSGPATHVVVQIHNRGVTPGFTTSPRVSNIQFGDQSGTTPTATANPTASASPKPTVKGALDYNAIRDFYAHQPVVPMSNQSIIYSPDGTISKVITGNQTTAMNYSVSGTVTGAADNAPISGATVKMGSNTQVTGSNGAYRFNNVAPGQYTIIVSAPGYDAKTQSIIVSSGDATLNIVLAKSAGAPAGNVTATPTAAPITTTATAAPTKTQSPGFGIVIASLGMLAAIFYISRKK